MEIDKKRILHLEKLSRLKLTGNERDQITGDLNQMLGMIEKLQEVDTNNIEPLVYLTESTQLLRDDVVKDELSNEEALKNAPDTDGTYFKVPKVIDL